MPRSSCPRMWQWNTKSPNVRPSEVHERLHLRERLGARQMSRVTVRDLHHVQELTVDARRLLGPVDLEVVLGEHLEMNLVLVELMGFPGVVLDDPFLHRSLRGDDRRRLVVVEFCI